MANEILFAGGRIDSLVVSGVPVEVTTAGRFNATYADSAVQISSTEILTANFLTTSGSVMAATDVVSPETVYAHFDLYFSTAPATTGINIATLHDSSGFPWLTIRTNNAAASYGFYYNSGTGAAPVWTQLGASATFTAAVIYTYDIKLTFGAPHTAELSQNGSVLVAATTFTQAALTSLRSLRLSGASTNFQANFSQILCGRGISTVGAFVKYSRATGAGTNTAWSGVFTDVNEPVGNDATVNTSTVTAQKESYAMGDVTVPGGFIIQTVFQFLRAKNNGAVPTNIKSLIRSGATDFSSGALTSPTFGTSFQPMGMRYDNDPATAAAWTQANWNAAEAGFESLT